MSARDKLEAYAGTPCVLPESMIVQALDAFRSEVLAEVSTWLVKKAREFRAEGQTVQADTASVLASKVERGAVRPDNLRMLPADFFEPGHTYRDDAYGWAFRVDTVTTHPEDGTRAALGWRLFKGTWEAIAYGEDDWGVHQHIGYTDVTEGGEGR